MKARGVGAAIEAREGFAWGRRASRATIERADVPPPRVEVVCEARAIEYEAAKGPGAPLEVWRHDHHRPFPLLCTAGRTDLGVSRSSRDCPRPSGRALFVLGRAVAVEGPNAEGVPVRVNFPPGVMLAADPVTKRIHFVRRGAARRAVAPFHYATAGSPYTITDRGIER